LTDLRCRRKGVCRRRLIIHEGQLTYQTQVSTTLGRRGVVHGKTNLPLPLGLDVSVRSGSPVSQQISQALRDSIEYANAHQKGALAYALKYARGLDTALAKRFIDMYVNEDTLLKARKSKKA